jgi:hypothetical protein
MMFGFMLKMHARSYGHSIFALEDHRFCKHFDHMPFRTAKHAFRCGIAEYPYQNICVGLMIMNSVRRFPILDGFIGPSRAERA